MQEVQLYIQNTKVDLFGDETISLTQTIQNVKDIEKIFTPFSKPLAEARVIMIMNTPQPTPIPERIARSGFLRIT